MRNEVLNMQYEAPALKVSPLHDVLEISDGGYIALPEETFPEKE